MGEIVTANSESMKDLSVVVLSYNRLGELRTNLPLLCETSAKTGFELIIVDNASCDGSREFLSFLKQRFLDLKVVLNEENLGVAAGRNLGWHLASRDFILNIDDDTRCNEHAMRSLLRIAKANPRIGVISPRIVHALTLSPQCDYGEEEYRFANFHGACHLVRADAFRKVGGIDPLCSFGGEELDYSIRLRAEGYDAIYTPTVTVGHNNFARTGTEGQWRRRQWVYNFSRVFFKHFPLNVASMFCLRYCISHIVSAASQSGLFFAISLLGAAIRGAFDGRKRYRVIPKTVLKFYVNSSLRPEFGNVSLFEKVLNFSRRRLTIY
jgi:GT2 family glycosyltransferase